MTEPITGWIWDRNLRAFLDLLSLYSGYAFDELDWEAIEAGVQDTDDEVSRRLVFASLGRHERHSGSHPCAKRRGEEMSVSVRGAETSELQLRTDTLLSAFSN
ncbi:hypothetical protein [Streptomyces collinus]|uniref:hypothetical protein n=1 Tax=Streptomyces collinus TaxID=42684 RepID=UPI0036B44A3A